MHFSEVCFVVQQQGGATRNLISLTLNQHKRSCDMQIIEDTRLQLPIQVNNVNKRADLESEFWNKRCKLMQTLICIVRFVADSML
jgi:hypothetical protein